MAEIDLVNEFAKHFCIICKKRITLMYGTPIVKIGGYCVGIKNKRTKIIYFQFLSMHYDCYVNASKQKVKLMLEFEEVKKAIKEERLRYDKDDLLQM